MFLAFKHMTREGVGPVPGEWQAGWGTPSPPLFCKIVYPKGLSRGWLQNRLSIGVTGKILCRKELAPAGPFSLPFADVP